MATGTLKFHCFTFRMPNKFLKNIFIKKKKKQKEKNIFIYLPGFFCYDSGWQRNLFIWSRVNKLMCQPERKHQKDIFTLNLQTN